MRINSAFSKAFLATAIGGIVLVAGAGVASAHASIPTDDLVAGSYGQVSIRVPHGCEGAATNIVEVQIPDGFLSIKPQAKAGWKVETEMVDLAEPVDNHGTLITERVGVIRWTNGNLPDNQYDEFGISLKAPDAAGTTAQFPTIQYCGTASVEWIGDESPSVDIVAADATMSGHSSTGNASMGEDQVQQMIDEAVATATADQSAQIEALTTQVQSADESSPSSALPVVALLAGLAGMGLALGAFAGRKR